MSSVINIPKNDIGRVVYDDKTTAICTVDVAHDNNRCVVFACVDRIKEHNTRSSFDNDKAPICIIIYLAGTVVFR